MKALFQPGGSPGSARRSRVRPSCHFDLSHLQHLLFLFFFSRRVALFYFFVVYNLPLLYDLFVSSLLGGVAVAVGRATELVEKVTGRVLKTTPPLLPLFAALYLSFSGLLFDFFFLSGTSPPSTSNPSFHPS